MILSWIYKKKKKREDILV